MALLIDFTKKFKAALLLILASWSAAGAPLTSPPPLNENSHLVVFTDGMPDDFMAYLGFISTFRANRGKNLLFVFTNPNTALIRAARQEKPEERKEALFVARRQTLEEFRDTARGLHNLFQLSGLTEARVVLGDISLEPTGISHVDNFQSVSRDFLIALSKARGIRKWDDAHSHYRQAVRAHVERSLVSEVLHMADPTTFLKAELSGRGIIRSRSMGLTNGLETAYNGANARSLRKLLQWHTERYIPLFDTPSHLYKDMEIAQASLNALFAKAVANPNASAMSAVFRAQGVLDGLRSYRDRIGQMLAQSIGITSEFFNLFDPEQEAWFPDSAFLAANLAKNGARYRAVEVQVSGTTQYTNQLEIKDSELSPIYLAEEFSEQDVLEKLRKILGNSYEKVHTHPAVGDIQKEGPAVVITGKMMIDDMTAKRMFMSLGDRFKLYVAESTNTPLLAEIAKAMFEKYGRSDIEVVVGKGDSLGDIEALEAQGIRNLSLEKNLIQEGLMGLGLIDEKTREAAMKQKVSQLREYGKGTWNAVEAIYKVLLENESVDLVINGTTREVEALFDYLETSDELSAKKRIALIRKIRTIHVMGGGSGTSEEFKVTRNWAMFNPSPFFEQIQRYGIKTYVYSTHHSGGFVTSTMTPNMAQVFRNLADLPAEQDTEMARIAINEGLASGMIFPDWKTNPKAPKIKVPEDNFGPALSTQMASMVALGEKAEEYFRVEPVDVVIEGRTKGRFKANAESTIFLVEGVNDNPHAAMVMDAVASNLIAAGRERIENPCEKDL